MRESYLRRLVVATILVVGLLAAPAAADAAWISKSEARGYAKKAVRELANDIDWVTAWWIERAPACERLRSNTVECDYELYDDDEGMYCADVVRVIAKRDTYRIRYPYESECGYLDEESY